MQHTIWNKKIELTVDTHGAEAVSLKKDGKEYIWNGNPEFWNRHAPVLFPFVGKPKDKKYRYEGKEYPMGQHGFARDMEFTLTKQEPDKLQFTLIDDDKTREVYPFHFMLQVEYKLTGSSVKVKLKVLNSDIKKLWFSIGGHPAFLCPPDGGQGTWDDYRIYFSKNGCPVDMLKIKALTPDGLVSHKKPYKLFTYNGFVTPTKALFDDDALIIEDRQADSVSLTDSVGLEYLRVDFDTPLFGVWSPAGKDAPFICIEPWYGLADSEDFNGDISLRRYEMDLDPGEKFKGGFRITVK